MVYPRLVTWLRLAPSHLLLGSTLLASAGVYRGLGQQDEVVTSLGGTVTHHHAVGRDHRSGYEAQSSPLYRQALQAAKASLDPAGIMNPGALIDPQGKDVGIRGIMGS